MHLSATLGLIVAVGMFGPGSGAALANRWSLTTLYAFCSDSGCRDGRAPAAGLVGDASGDLFGTTAGGGAHGRGTVFKIPAGGVLQVLYDFCAAAQCADGAYPNGPLLLDAAGNLYGTTGSGGAHGRCAVFELTAGGTERVLHSFCSAAHCADGDMPNGSLLMDNQGNLYGTTNSGGSSRLVPGSGGLGAVFEVTPNGEETVLYDLCSVRYCLDGSNPSDGLVMDGAGSLYGTTYGGGTGRESHSKGGANARPRHGVQTGARRHAKRPL